VVQPVVVVIGDANPDLVLTGDVVPRFGQAEQLLDAADLVLGGSAAIVACGLARLGVPTALVAVVGDDAFGTMVRESLEALGVDTRWLRTEPAVATGISVILSGADRAILTHPGTIAATGPGVLPNPDELRGVRHVHSASVYLQPQLAPVLPAYLRDARTAGISTSIDTNWDPAETWAVARGLIEHTDVVLPNAAELRAITGIDDLDSAAAELTRGGAVVALKNGAEGGVAWSPDGLRCASPGLAVDVVDTTGAGDTFDAGFISAWIDGLGLEASLARAVAAGSLSTRVRGGTAAQPTLAEIDRLN
jgi:sugar/nucleoside kinase (ribokinase family)